MTDFFGALELELHAAAARRPRRALGIGEATGLLAAAALVAVAVLLTMVARGGGDSERGQVTAAPKPDPVGTVLPKGKAAPYETRALVVANGTAPVNGPWQLEVSRTRGERDMRGQVMWERGYCFWLHILDPPGREVHSRGGHCGSPRSLGFRKTPGFSRGQSVARWDPGPPKEIIVWGRVPDRAARVVIAGRGARRIEVVPTDGPKTFPGRYYGIPVRPPFPGARINWLDASGKPGSRGIRLMPPLGRPVRR